MNVHMTVEVEVCEETLGALIALESLFPNMDLNMFIEVGFLGKVLRAVVIWALVWSLLSVDSEVVEEIVPFPEVPVTIFVLALQYFNASLGLGIFKSVDFEVLGCGNMLLYLDGF